MSFRVETTVRAERDRQTCYDYIFERSRDGATRWADAYDDALESLERVPFRGLAPESDLYAEEIRQTFFATPAGLTYRVLFIIRGEIVYVLHIRGPGQDMMSPDEVEFPPGNE